METVAAHSVGRHGAWDGQDVGDLGQGRVEDSVETGDLRQRRVMRFGKPDQRQGRWTVERGQGDRLFELGDDIVIDPGVPPQRRTAMHDTVADRSWTRNLCLGQRGFDAFEQPVLEMHRLYGARGQLDDPSRPDVVEPKFER